jgi:hypothetical protein
MKFKDVTLIFSIKKTNLFSCDFFYFNIVHLLLTWRICYFMRKKYFNHSMTCILIIVRTRRASYSFRACISWYAESLERWYWYFNNLVWLHDRAELHASFYAPLHMLLSEARRGSIVPFLTFIFVPISTSIVLLVYSGTESSMVLLYLYGSCSIWWLEAVLRLGLT